jgi:hypothetical protein
MATQHPKLRPSLLSAIALVGVSIPLSLLAGGLPAMARDHDNYHGRPLIRLDLGRRHHVFDDYYRNDRDRHQYIVYFRRDDDDSWQYEGTYWNREDAERMVRRLERKNYYARYERD